MNLSPETKTASSLSRGQIRLIRTAGAVSVAVATTLVGLKTWAWLATGSVAMLSSLADSILDLLVSIMTLLAVRFALEPADHEHRFGHGKLEAVAGLAQALVISASAAYVAFQAITRLFAPQSILEPAIGGSVMVLSLALTIALVSFQRFVVRKTNSLAIGADALHYQADVLTNIAVLGAIAVDVLFGWYLADPLLGLVVVGLILISVRDIIVQSFDVLLDRELSSRARREIREIATSHSAVRGVHDLRTRTSGIADFIQFHLELDPELSLEAAHSITDEVEDAVKQHFPKAEVLIHADPYGLEEPRDSF